MSSQLDAWRRRLDTARLPGWLVAFDENPERVVSDVLLGRELLDAASPADAADLLVDWFDVLGSAGDFSPRLDRALATFIAASRPSVFSDVPRMLGLARAFDVVGQSRDFTQAGQTLRLLAESRSSLTGGPSGVDLPGRYLNAVARHQIDRVLIPLWRDVAGLPAGVHWHTARYAVAGVQLAPALSHEVGGFRAEVARTVVEVIRSLTRKVVEGEIDAATARREQRSILRLSFRAYPSEEGWRAVVSDALLVDLAFEPTPT